MIRRVVHAALAVVVVSLSFAGCGARSETGLTAKARKAALQRSGHAPRRFTYEHTSQGVRTTMTADVEDDYRYRVTTSVGDQVLYEEVTFDDRRAVRVGAPDVVPEPLRTDPGLAALAAGGWVADAAPAPGEFRKLDAPVVLLDPKMTLDKVRFLEKLATDPPRLRRFEAAARYDPKSTSYLRRNDKFPPHPEAGVRYDLVPGSYDLDRIFENGVPNDLVDILDNVALYSSFWFKDGRLTRVERFLDIDDKELGERIRRVVANEAKRAGVPAGTLPIPPTPRPYRDVYTFSYGAPPQVVLPATTATVAFPITGDARG